MLKASPFDCDLRLPGGLVENGVTYITVGSDDFTGAADMLAVVTPEAPHIVEMSDVVRVSPPVNLHLRKHVCLKDPLQFGYCSVYRVSPGLEDVGIVLAVVLIDS